jgi:hypothetical protein
MLSFSLINLSIGLIAGQRFPAFALIPVAVLLSAGAVFVLPAALPLLLPGLICMQFGYGLAIFGPYLLRRTFGADVPRSHRYR